jgi:hypothetical protein
MNSLPSELHALLANPETPPWVAHDRFLEAGITTMKVFLLTGESGKWSDVESWPIASFLSKEAAEKYRDGIIEEKRHMNSRSNTIWEDLVLMYSSVLDTKADPADYLTVDQITTRYEIVEIELKVGSL